jgi:2,3-bisphosphoglycerate-independent phosphoglycerate mutase
MQTLHDLYGIGSGVVISAVDLIKGIGIYAGLKPIDVDGATGLYDTNYEGKAQAAIEALRGDTDFVFLHVEASDEAGHEGDVALKIKTIEYLDSRIVAPILKAVKQIDEPVAIAVLPDHPTPCDVRTHTSELVPFAIYNPMVAADGVTLFDEESARTTGLSLAHPTDFMKLFLAN